MAAAIVVVLDVLLAQVYKLAGPEWRTTDYHYRVKSALYDHDLATDVETEGVSGGIHFPVRTNNLGFRDANVRKVSLRNDAFRLVFIGDSFTEGIGVPYEDTFVGIIAEHLKSEGIEVLNAAVSSYSPAIYYRKIKYLIEKVGLEFDELIVFVDISDVEDEALYYALDDQENVVRLRPPANPPSLVRTVKTFLKENSVAVRFGDLLKDKLISSWNPPDAIGSMRDRAMWTGDNVLFARYGELGLRKARRNMDRLLRLLCRHNVDLTIVVYPWPHQIISHDLHSLQVKYWRAWAEENEVEFLNLFPLFITGENESAIIANYFIPGNVHWNTNGHRLVADAFLTYSSRNRRAAEPKRYRESTCE